MKFSLGNSTTIQARSRFHFIGDMASTHQSFYAVGTREDRWHAGYYIDAPAGKSYCVTSYSANDGLQFNFDGRSLFSAVERYLDDKELINDEDDVVLTGAVLEENKKACDKVRKALLKYQPLAKKSKLANAML